MNLGADQYINKLGKPETVYTELVHGIYKVVKMKCAEEELEKKTKHLTLINSINSAINRGDSLQKVIQLLSKETKKLFSCYGATIFLLSEDKNFLVTQNLNLSKTTMNRIEKLIGRKISQTKIPLKSGSLYLKALQEREPPH